MSFVRESHDGAKTQNYFVAIVVVFWMVLVMDFRNMMLLLLCIPKSIACKMNQLTVGSYCLTLAVFVRLEYYLTTIFLLAIDLFIRVLLIFIAMRSKNYILANHKHRELLPIQTNNN